MMMTDDTVLIPVMMDAGQSLVLRNAGTSLVFKSHEKNKNSVGKYCRAELAGSHWRHSMDQTFNSLSLL